MAKLIAKNWGDFQHYKDRAPTWIKLHKKLLDDFEFQCLPVASKALAPMLWLLASEETDGSIEFRADKIAFRLRMTEQDLKEAIKPLIDNGFFSLLDDCYQDASTILAECLPREEKRRDREEKEKKEVSPRSPVFDLKGMELPECLNSNTWEEWIDYRRSRKLTCTERTMRAQIASLEQWWHQGHNPNEIIKTSITNGWQGLFEPKTQAKPAQLPCSKTENERLAEQFVKEGLNFGTIGNY